MTDFDPALILTWTQVLATVAIIVAVAWFVVTRLVGEEKAAKIFAAIRRFIRKRRGEPPETPPPDRS